MNAHGDDSDGDETPGSAAPLPASRELFDDWLEAQHPRVCRFQDFITPIEVRTDFTRESFADLEQYILEKYPPGSDPLAPPRDWDFLDGAMRYIGETLLRHCGGRWDYDTTPNFVFRGRPFVWLDVPDAVPISPLNQITAMVARREPLLTRLFDNQTRMKREAAAADFDDAPPPGVGAGSDLRAWPPQPSAWVAGVPERLAQWTDSVRGIFDADLTRESLTALTELVRHRIPTTEAFDDPANAQFVEGAVIYLGETMRTAAGGRWVFGPGERDVDHSVRAGVPYLVREVHDTTLEGHPYWAMYDLADGKAVMGPEFEFDRYRAAAAALAAAASSTTEAPRDAASGQVGIGDGGQRRLLESAPDATPVEQLRTAALNDVMNQLSGQSGLHDTPWEAFAIVAAADGQRLTRMDAIAYDAHGVPDEMILSTFRMRPSLERLLPVFEGPDGHPWRVAVIGYRRDTREMTTRFFYGPDADPYLMSPHAWRRIAAYAYPRGSAGDQPPAEAKAPPSIGRLYALFTVCTAVIMFPWIWLSEGAKPPQERLLLASVVTVVVSTIVVFMTWRERRKKRKRERKLGQEGAPGSPTYGSGHHAQQPSRKV